MGRPKGSKDRNKEESFNNHSIGSKIKWLDPNFSRNIIREQIARNVEEFLNWYRGLKTECSRCGADPGYAKLDYHHPDPDTKLFGIAEMVKVIQTGRLKNKRYFETDEYIHLLEEMAKCVLLCKRCHAKHWGRERRAA